MLSLFEDEGDIRAYSKLFSEELSTDSDFQLAFLHLEFVMLVCSRITRTQKDDEIAKFTDKFINI